ncbi:hypothetical protein B0J14DRAFT_606006 [Halenospora varia]|nr:hypothetical protein B0J14DRAFT_606006 [Halenospora varia]
MDKLPTELLYRIISQFSHALPERSQLFSRPDNTNFLFNFPFKSRIEGAPDVTTLLRLRLANRAINQAATDVLFKHKPFVLCSSGINCLNLEAVTSTNPSVTLRDGLDPGMPLENLRIVGLYMDSNSRTESDIFEDSEPGEEDRQSPLIKNEALSRVIPLALRRMATLDAISIKFSPLTSTYLSKWSAPLVDASVNDKVSTAIGMGLASSTLPYLTTLLLCLPCTHDFVAFSNSASQELLERLTVLELGISDATGYGGSREYQDTNAGTDPRFDDMEVPGSALQKMYPNVDYQDAMFRIASRCINLKVLRISCTHYLDANFIQWIPAQTRLRALSLLRVKISAKNLIRLMAPCTSKEITDLDLRTSVIEHIQLEEIDLTTGEWWEVFEAMQMLPKLSFLNPSDLNYAWQGDNPQWRNIPSDYDNNGRSLQSTNDRDHDALKKLVEGLVENAGGFEEYPDWEFSLYELRRGTNYKLGGEYDSDYSLFSED